MGNVYSLFYYIILYNIIGLERFKLQSTLPILDLTIV